MSNKIELNELTQVVHNEKNFLVALNENLERIQKAINDTLSRTGVAPNAMQEVLDMNGKRIVNLGAPQDANDVVRKQDIQDIINRANEAIERLGGLVREAQYTLEVYGREVIVEAVEAKDAAVVAKTAAQEAKAAADASAASAAESAESAEIAKEATEGASDLAWAWAAKTNGAVADGEYSAKAYAIGGVGTSTNNAKYFKDQAQAIYEDIEDSIEAIENLKRAQQVVTLGTPSGEYTGGTDKIETGISLADKAVNVFWNGQLISATGNYGISGNNVVFTGMTPSEGDVITLWINAIDAVEDYSKVIVRSWN